MMGYKLTVNGYNQSILLESDSCQSLLFQHAQSGMLSFLTNFVFDIISQSLPMCVPCPAFSQNVLLMSLAVCIRLSEQTTNRMVQPV